MLLLGIDTSGKSGGITLAEGDQGNFRVLESSPIAGGTFSAQLVPTIAALLERHARSANDIGGFAVASGPGSFTGLRVGLSGVKGLAEVLGAPIATVSVLEALASFCQRPGRVAAALDAGRSEVYFALYHLDPSAMVRIAENLIPRSEYLQQLNDPQLEAAVTSDAPLAELASSVPTVVVPEVVDRPGSETIARLGLRKLMAGQTVSVEALDANYLRRSDAEIFAPPQSSVSGKKGER
ncbi:MAG TPA: tRNA (adenosine(37)-N6)-threonylcarbamoyltransferase complex dimerization subunit type 1 TsaB [Terriglobales bacterium]